MADIIPVASLLLAGAGTAVSTIQGADALGQANKQADKQTAEEQKLIDKATNQQNQENSNAKAAVSNAAAIAARRALAGNSSGFNSTVLGAGAGSTASLNLFQPGKTLLG
jgi:hypothetical protein